MECCEGGGDAGYSCIETRTLLTDESVTTKQGINGCEALLSYSTLINADTIAVTFNGKEYICERFNSLDYNTYGAPFDILSGSFDWSVYPFAIASGEGISGTSNELCTELEGTYQVKIETRETAMEISDCFKDAVNSSLTTPPILRLVAGVTTQAEVEQAVADGSLMYMQAQLDNYKEYAVVRSYSGGSFSTIPNADSLGWEIIMSEDGVVGTALITH